MKNDKEQNYKERRDVDSEKNRDVKTIRRKVKKKQEMRNELQKRKGRDERKIN